MTGEDRSWSSTAASGAATVPRSAPLLPRPRGPAAALRVSGKPNRDAAARHIGWRGTATDVTVETEARKAAEFLSGHDALTGCLNRSGLVEGLGEVLDATRRRSELAAFLMLDIDGFKEVNDIYGPVVGDS